MNTFAIIVKPRLNFGITVKGHEIFVRVSPTTETIGAHMATPNPVMSITVRPRVRLSPTVRAREKFVIINPSNTRGSLTPEQEALINSIPSIEQTASTALVTTAALALEIEKLKQLTYAAL